MEIVLTKKDLARVHTTTNPGTVNLALVQEIGKGREQ